MIQRYKNLKRAISSKKVKILNHFLPIYLHSNLFLLFFLQERILINYVIRY